MQLLQRSGDHELPHRTTSAPATAPSRAKKLQIPDVPTLRGDNWAGPEWGAPLPTKAELQKAKDDGLTHLRIPHRLATRLSLDPEGVVDSVERVCRDADEVGLPLIFEVHLFGKVSGPYEINTSGQLLTEANCGPWIDFCVTQLNALKKYSSYHAGDMNEPAHKGEIMGGVWERVSRRRADALVAAGYTNRVLFVSAAGTSNAADINTQHPKGSWVSHIKNAAIEVHHYERTEVMPDFVGDYKERIRSWYTDGWTDKRWDGVTFFVGETFYSAEYLPTYLELAKKWNRSITLWASGRFDKSYKFFVSDRLRAILTGRA